MKFSIRDLLLVTVIVALAVGWWIDHRRLSIHPYFLTKHKDPFAKKPIALPNSSARAPNPPKK